MCKYLFLLLFTAFVLALAVFVPLSLFFCAVVVVVFILFFYFILFFLFLRMQMTKVCTTHSMIELWVDLALLASVVSNTGAIVYGADYKAMIHHSFHFLYVGDG